MTIILKIPISDFITITNSHITPILKVSFKVLDVSG